jgi:DNA (cytosine-5)-methyltransferase 1
VVFSVEKPTYIDLFAGCGGLSLGLFKAGWRGLFAIEKSPDAFETLQYNLIQQTNHFQWPAWLEQKNHNINTVLQSRRSELEKLKGKVDMVTGGPPCQGFSTAGKRNEEDQRNKLILSYIKFIKLVEPKIIFFENVRGFTMGFDQNKTKGKKYSAYVIKKLTKAGYDVHGEIVDFSEFGVPQKRCRFILVGVRKDISQKNHSKAEDFFRSLKENRKQFLVNRNLEMNVTLESAISDLLKQHGTIDSPDTKNFKHGIYQKSVNKYQAYLRMNVPDTSVVDSHRFPNHNPYIIDRFQYILNTAIRGKTISDDAKKKYSIKKHTIVPLDGNKPAPTVTTLPDDYVHYCEPRILTVRECARIQSFPDSYLFKGKYTTGGKMRVKEVPRYTQVGNAIPPLFGEQSGLALKELLVS